MKRRSTLFLASAALAAAGFTPAAVAQSQACDPPPGRSSLDGRWRIRTYPLVVLGNIDGNVVPEEPHGVYTITFNISKWYSGATPRTVTITNYGNLDLFEGYEQPRNQRSLANTVDILKRFAGQKAVFFLSPRDNALGRDPEGRYRDGYATHDCHYNVVGNDAVSTFLPLLEDIFSKPVPTFGPRPASPTPSPAATGDPQAVGDSQDEGRSGPITRAAGLAALVAAALILYRSPRSPLFERWRGRR